MLDMISFSMISWYILSRVAIWSGYRVSPMSLFPLLRGLSQFGSSL
jgi:hypothetical protein